MLSSILTWLGSSAVGQIVVKAFDFGISFFNAKQTTDQKNNTQAQNISKLVDESNLQVNKIVLEGKSPDEYLKDIAE